MARFSNNSVQQAWLRQRYDAQHAAQQDGEEFVEPSFANINKVSLERDALAAVYSLTDKVLTKSTPTVHLVNDDTMTVPAMNDGKDIYIRTIGLGERVNDIDIAALHGLNYHEVAHLLYSPRVGSAFGQWVKDNDIYLRAMNLLEDARIETLLTHKYPTVIPYLNRAMVKELANNINAANFLVTRGRRHLPLQVRQIFAGLAVKEFGSEKVKALASLIDEFRVLNIFQQPDRAKEIIIEFHNLIADIADPASANGCEKAIKDQWGRVQEKARPMLKAGRTESPKSIQELLNQITDNDKPAEDLENLEGWDKESDQQGEGEGDDQQGEGEGDDQQGEQSLSNQLQQSVSEIGSDQSVADEVKRVRKMVRESVGSTVSNNIKRHKPLETPVSQSTRIMAIKFARELEQLQAETDPSWVMEQPSGRVNIQRYMRRDPNGLNKIFDRWSEGNFSHEIEAVVLTDCSGSMGAVMQEANEAAWVIKRALESIQGEVTSYAFNEAPKLIYSADERTSASHFRNTSSSGGTSPLDCLIASQRIFMASQKTTKLLFMVTDGYWSSTTMCDQLLREMESEGVVTISIYLDSPYYRTKNNNPLNIKSSYYSHYEIEERETVYKNALTTLFHDANIKHYLTDPKQIVEVAKSVARTQIKGAL